MLVECHSCGGLFPGEKVRCSHCDGARTLNAARGVVGIGLATALAALAGCGADASTTDGGNASVDSGSSTVPVALYGVVALADGGTP